MYWRLRRHTIINKVINDLIIQIILITLDNYKYDN